MATVLAPVLEANDPRLVRIQPRRFGPGQFGGVSGGSGGGSAGGSSAAPIPSLSGYAAPTLNWRQTRAFIHRADVWRPVFARSSTGAPQPLYWQRVMSGVACHFRFRSGLTEAQLAALLESQDLQTADTCKFGQGMPLDDYWILVNRNVEPDGTHAENWGKAWIVRGEPARTVDGGGREAGQTKAYVGKKQLVPPEVS